MVDSKLKKQAMEKEWPRGARDGRRVEYGTREEARAWYGLLGGDVAFASLVLKQDMTQAI